MSVAETSCRGGRVELTIGLLILATIVGAGVGLALARSTRVEPGLVIDPQELDFGTAWEQTEYQHLFEVKNPTDQPIRVAEIKTSCGCTTIEPRTFTLGAGESRKVMATLNLTGYGGEPFAVELLPKLAHQPPGRQTVWSLRGRVRTNPIELSEASVDFGSKILLSEPLPIRELRVTVPPHLHAGALSVHITEGEGRLDVQSHEEGQWQLRISPSERLGIGTFSFTVRVKLDFPQLHTSPYRDIRVTGLIEAEAAAWPRSLDFGVLNIGDTSTDYINIASYSGQPFRVMQVDAPDNVTVEIVSQRTEEPSSTFAITPKAIERGAYRKEVTFHVKLEKRVAEDAATIALPIPITYYGTHVKNR